MLRIFCKWSLLLCTALCAHAGWAQVLELTGDEGRPTRPPLAYFVDESADMSLPAVLAIPATEFVDSGTGGLALGFTRSVVWLKIDIINRSSEIDNWLMQINDPLLDDIRVYQQDATGEWTEKRLGDQGVTAEDAVDSITPVLPVTLAENRLNRFMIRVESDSSMLLDVRFMTARQFFQASMTSFLAYGAMYGIVAAMCMYNLFLFFSLRDFNYLLYVVSMLSTSVFLASLSGHAPRWLWPEHTAWSEEIYQVICAVVIISGLWFADRFLEAADRSPRMHRVILTLIGLAALTVPFAAVSSFQVSIHLTGFVSAGAGAAGILTAITSLRSGHRPARFYLLAWTGYCLGAILMAGRRHGLVDNNFITTHAMEVGAVLETVLISFALSDRYKQMRQAKEDAQREIAENLMRMDRLKDEFLANTSHELRTPLQGIIGLAESMLDGAAGKLGKTAAYNLSMIVSSGQRLAHLVSDILDFSKMKNHDLSLNLKPVDLHVAADVVIHLSGPLAQAKSLELVNEISRDLPQVMADEQRLQQILHNLIGNAIKFTDSGSVRVSARREEDNIRLLVTDTGPGIAVADQQRIFDSFEQVEESTTRVHGGTGLGLAVTRDLVRLHGSQVDLDSALGKGSSFSFTLPVADSEQLARATEAAVAPLPTPAVYDNAITGFAAAREAAEQAPEQTPIRVARGERIRILVVDDEPINQLVMQNHLVIENYDTVQAENGMRALDLLARGEQFDLVLLDVMMPKLSGFEVCREIRKTHLPTQLPILMVTARTQLHDLQFGLKVGANDYLTKPVAKDELLARIRTHLNLMHINSAYSRYVPHEFLRYLHRDSIIDVQLGDNVELEAAVLISDIRGFTTLSETMTPDANFSFINDYLAHTGPPIRENGGFIDRYTGDSVMGVFPGGAGAALQAARDTMSSLNAFNIERQNLGLEPIRIGIGLHIGSLRLGIVGEHQRRQGDIFADAVNVANRIEGLTKTFGASVIVSDSLLRALANADVDLPLRRTLGRVSVKGRLEPVTLHEAFEFDPAELVEHKRGTCEAFDSFHLHFEAKRYAEAKAALAPVVAAQEGDLAARYLLDLAASQMQHGSHGGR